MKIFCAKILQNRSDADPIRSNTLKFLIQIENEMKKSSMNQSQCCCYDFTLGIDQCPEKDELINWLSQWCKKWAFQKEKGEETGWIHWQGRFSLHNKVRGSTLKESVPWKEMHFTPTVKDHTKGKAFYANYISKSETRQEGPWMDTDDIIEIPRQVKEIQDKLRPWQGTVVDMIKIWDTRHIDCIIDVRGGIGKTMLMLYLRCLRLAYPIPFSTDYKDIMAGVMDRPKVRGYILDVPRSIPHRDLCNVFAALETIKGGYAFDTRYRFRDAVFDCPNPWVFINLEEEEILKVIPYLSRDRWRFWRVSSKMELKAHPIMASLEDDEGR